MEENKNKSPMAIASFVLGIISLTSVFFWYITIWAGILAIVFGAKSTKKTGSKLGKAGLIMGIVGLSVFAFIYISLIILLLISGI